MWARRCGVPAKWPSRIKVVLMSLINAVVGMALYNWVNGADVGYLDLQTPVESEIVCLTSWPERGAFTKLFDVDGWHDWLMLKSDTDVYRSENACPSTNSSANLVSINTCEQVDIPLQDMKRKLGISMSHSHWHASDQIMIYATIFLALAICLWSAVITHDLTLLSTNRKDFILDLSGIFHTYRAVQFAFRVLGFELWPVVFKCFRNSQLVFAILGCVIVLPTQLVWSAFAFLFITCPTISFFFIRHPLRTNRLWVFVLCIAFAIFGVVLSVYAMVFLAGRGTRPQFSVTWHRSDPAPERDLCICGCSYQVSDSTCLNFLFIGLGCTIQSILIATRCLKGLRRSNWANLLTVTFPIPLTAYSVEWTQPDGQPIKNRKEGQPVQSELAFDPFALMDEQPNSASTTVTLQPVPVPPILKEKTSRTLDGPQLPRTLEAAAKLEDWSPMEYIGCCGFPCRTGGKQVRLQMLEEDETPGEECKTEGLPSDQLGSAEQHNGRRDEEQGADKDAHDLEQGAANEQLAANEKGANRVSPRNIAML